MSLAELNGRVDAVIDGGPCEVGIESAIVGFGKDGPVLLREGGIVRSSLEKAMQRTFAPSPAHRRPPGTGFVRESLRPFGPAAHERRIPCAGGGMARLRARAGRSSPRGRGSQSFPVGQHAGGGAADCTPACESWMRRLAERDASR